MRLCAHGVFMDKKQLLMRCLGAGVALLVATATVALVGLVVTVRGF